MTQPRPPAAPESLPKSPTTAVRNTTEQGPRGNAPNLKDRRPCEESGPSGRVPPEVPQNAPEDLREPMRLWGGASDLCGHPGQRLVTEAQLGAATAGPLSRGRLDDQPLHDGGDACDGLPGDHPREELQPRGVCTHEFTAALPADRLTLTVNEVAKLLGLGRSSTYQAVRTGEIPSIKVGRRYLVPVTALRAWLGDT